MCEDCEKHSRKHYGSSGDPPRKADHKSSRKSHHEPECKHYRDSDGHKSSHHDHKHKSCCQPIVVQGPPGPQGPPGQQGPEGPSDTTASIKRDGLFLEKLDGAPEAYPININLDFVSEFVKLGNPIYTDLKTLVVFGFPSNTNVPKGISYFKRSIKLNSLSGIANQAGFKFSLTGVISGCLRIKDDSDQIKNIMVAGSHGALIQTSPENEIYVCFDMCLYSDEAFITPTSK